MTEQKTALKPCPFCGNENIERKKKACRCLECGCEGPYTSEDIYDDQCEKDWNNRYDQANQCV